MNNRLFRYLLIAFGWTWGCWIGAMLLSASMGHVLSTDQTIFELVRSFTTSEAVLPQVLFALGVYGPLLGYLAVRPGRAFQREVSGGMRFIWMAILIPIILVVPVVLLSMLTGIGRNGEGIAGNVPVLVVLYFLSNLVTSGTEEFGWRGFLYPHLREKEKTFWDASWKGGILWAIWHFPLLFILYSGQGAAVLVPTLVGFTAGIVAMNYITNFIYEKTASIPLVMVMHALNNSASFAVLLFFPGTPFLLLVHLAAWGVVGYLEKTYHLT